MNNKGFTMIELLASMVLLSVLMLTAVPTVLKVMDDSRKNTIINDSKKFIANVEYKVKNNNNNIKRPKDLNTGRNCILVTLGYLDLGSEFKKGPHGGAYSLDDSYVIVKLKSLNGSDGKVQMYDYYVTLVETYGDGANYGVYLLPFSSLSTGNPKKYVDGLTTDKLLSKTGASPELFKLPANLTTGTNPPVALGCNAFANNDDPTADTIYDADDSLIAQGVS